MPKLSKQTLEKRFPCPNCGQKLRTRQGLSGHIQYKHHSGSGAQEKSLTDWLADIKIYQAIMKAAGYSKPEREELTAVLRDWVYTKSLLETRNMVVNSSDEKLFLIARFAQMLANRRLLDTLRKDLATIIPELMKYRTTE